MRATSAACAARSLHASDGDLVELALQRDGQAFELLVERHQSRVYGLALRMLKDSAVAEEVLQETFLAAWKKLPQYRAQAAFGSWLYRICANLCLMRLRHQALERQAGPALAGPSFDASGTLLGDLASDWTRETDQGAMDHELRQAIEEAVSSLPDEHRALFLLKDLEGLSYEEIAQTLGLPMPTVKSRLHRARLALREAIEAFYARGASAQGPALVTP